PRGLNKAAWTRRLGQGCLNTLLGQGDRGCAVGGGATALEIASSPGHGADRSHVLKTMTSDSRTAGLDFGTSNSALAVSSANGHASLHIFRTEHSRQETFPSVLHVPPRRQPQVTAGPWAGGAYRSSGERGARKSTEELRP